MNSTNKLIWFAGIPSSGKTTMAMKLELELEWAGKKTILLDDEQIKRVKYSDSIQKVLDLIGEEYNIIVTPDPRKLPRNPDLIVWCKCSLEEAIKRDRAKIITDKDRETETIRFNKFWGSYYIEADLILNTYVSDGGTKTEENIEKCWQELKRKMEELFGDFKWRVCPDQEPKFSSYKPDHSFPF